jgi:hypothetical protein
MSHNEEFLEILSVLLSQQPSAELSLPESSVPDAAGPDAAPLAKRSEEKKGRGVRS